MARSFKFLRAKMLDSPQKAAAELAESLHGAVNPSSLPLDEQQQQKITEWDTEHKQNCLKHPTRSAIGGRLTYSFTPTGLGMITKVRCACGAEIDVTPYDEL